MKRALGLLGAILLGIGVFLPSWEMGSGDYLAVLAFRTEGYLIIACSVASLISVILKRFRMLWVLGLGSLWAMSLAYTRMDALGWESHVKWGWAALLVGSALIIAASIIKDGLVERYRHNSTVNTSHTT